MMRCDRARVLIGIHDEIDAPSRRALKAHVNACPACAGAWLEEARFRQLMAGRTAPLPSHGLESRLLAVPARDWRRFKLRARISRWGPPLLATLALVIGGTRLLEWPNLGLGPGSKGESASLHGDPGGSRDVRRGPADHSRALPTPWARRRIASPPARATASPPPGAKLAQAGPGTASGGQAARATWPPRGSPPGARGAGAVSPESLGDPVTASPIAPPETAPAGRDPNDARPSRTPSAPVAPTTIPTAAQPTSPPAPTETPEGWRITLRVEVSDPAADLTGETVVIHVERGAGEGFVTLYEERLTFSGRVVVDTPTFLAPPPYFVELFSALPAYPLCPGSARTRTVAAGDLIDRQGEVAFRLCSGSPTPPPTAVEPTPVGGSAEPEPPPGSGPLPAPMSLDLRPLDPTPGGAPAPR